MTLRQPPAVLLEGRSTCAAVSQGRASSLPDHTSSTVTTAALIKSRVQTDSRCSCRFGASVQGSCCSCHYFPCKGIREPPLVAGNYGWNYSEISTLLVEPRASNTREKKQVHRVFKYFPWCHSKYVCDLQKKKKSASGPAISLHSGDKILHGILPGKWQTNAICPRGVFLAALPPTAGCVVHWHQFVVVGVQYHIGSNCCLSRCSFFSFETIRLSYQVQTLGKMGRINPTTMQFTKREVLGY